mmetsp:Transcript_35147/g.83272  ORF Transcript_35147/g.83272 Transcript_35147/m.83272 type:complete len:415 (+) Transcript_35147:1-1245(+)
MFGGQDAAKPLAPVGGGGAPGSGGGKSGDYHTLKLDEHTKRPQAVTCVAVNKDGTRFAFSPSNNEVHIVAWDGAAFSPVAVLREHDQRVTALDWAPESNMLVSCSQDRNAYVWKEVGGVWKPSLVHLRLNRAATYCKWSHSEKKFAVCAGDKSVAVCYYEAEEDWWISKVVDGFESTVLTAAWDQSDTVLAAGSSDGTVRLFTAALKSVDNKPAQLFGPDVSFKKMGVPFCEVRTDAWVNDVCFSPSGDTLAYVTHDSRIHFLTVVHGAPPDPSSVQSVRCSGLPHHRLLFVEDDKVIAAGHDLNPTAYVRRGGVWSEGGKLDDSKAGKASVSAGASARSAAFKKFEMSSTQGTEGGAVASAVATRHQNCISDLATCVAWGAPNKCRQVVSVGLDGRLCMWDLSVEAAMAALKL